MTPALALLIMMNAARAPIAPLTLSPILTARAEVRADYLCVARQWSHKYWLINFAGLDSQKVGENLECATADMTGTCLFTGSHTPEETMRALMRSPEHRANMLNANYKQVGIATECGVTVELFADHVNNGNDI